MNGRMMKVTDVSNGRVVIGTFEDDTEFKIEIHRKVPGWVDDVRQINLSRDEFRAVLADWTDFEKELTSGPAETKPRHYNTANDDEIPDER